MGSGSRQCWAGVLRWSVNLHPVESVRHYYKTPTEYRIEQVSPPVRQAIVVRMAKRSSCPGVEQDNVKSDLLRKVRLQS